MYINKLSIKGYRKFHNAEITLSNCSFLIGENNSGKSSLFKIIKFLLSGSNKGLDPDDFCSVHDSATGNTVQVSKEIVVEAEFRNLPFELKEKKGFKGRIFEYKSDEESGLKMVLKKTFQADGTVEVEILTKKRTPKTYKTYKDIEELGISLPSLIDDIGDIQDSSKKVSAAHRKVLDTLDNMVDVGDEDVWEKNPLGLINVFSSYLPLFIEIPALHSFDELNGNRGTSAIGEILKSLFDEVRDKSLNYKRAQIYLNKLSAELSPTDKSTEFGKMIDEVNTGFDKLFTNARFHVSVDLSKPNESIKPTFNTSVSSNLKTKIENQGTGLSRSAIFSLLNYRASWQQKRADTNYKRALFIAFEEPELYLHPTAVKQIRDFIYDLAEAGNTQIVCSTHSPSMIDLSREKTNQIINRMMLSTKQVQVEDKKWNVETVTTFLINHSEILKKLEGDEKDHLKMLLRMDATIVESFFVGTAVIVEGDTEQVVINETLSLLSPLKRDKIVKSRTIIRARGKPIIISLVRYLNALGISFKVMHDADLGTEGQENINKHIREACGAENVYALSNCIEDTLGYKAPTRDKPYSAFNYIQKNWKKDKKLVPNAWKTAFEFLFNETID